jgi:hypothetical protein
LKIFVCIDDTDNLESRGTGELASILADDVEKKGWGISSYITRHQLLVHPDVPYTSHNSAMCFSADVDEKYLETLISHAADFLEKESAEGSDPGLCVAVAEQIKDSEALIDFGKKAKQVVLTQNDAYALAQKLGLHLTPHGGTGHGVIGALAGIGLRLSGNDGRLRGGLQFGSENSIVSVSDICVHPHVDAVSSMEGQVLQPEEQVRLGDKMKTVLLGGKSVLLVMPSNNETDNVSWRACPRQLLKRY